MFYFKCWLTRKLKFVVESDQINLGDKHIYAMQIVLQITFCMAISKILEKPPFLVVLNCWIISRTKTKCEFICFSIWKCFWLIEKEDICWMWNVCLTFERWNFSCLVLVKCAYNRVVFDAKISIKNSLILWFIRN